jgi:hypothetical protein
MSSRSFASRFESGSSRRRLHHEGTRERKALLLPARKRGSVARGEIVELDDRERPLDLLADLRSLQPLVTR